MDVSLIKVPYMVGDEQHSSSKGPHRLVQAGAHRLLSAHGLEVSVESIDRGGPFRDSGSSSLAVCKQLASVVGGSIKTGRFPLVLGGTCEISKGVLAGFDHSHCGVVWLDAHGDFNTPDSTISGYFPGMSLAVVAGHCYANYWKQIGYSAPIPETSVLLLGVRDLDPAEQDRLEISGIKVVKWHQGTPARNVTSAIQDLARRVPEIHLHIDMDCLDADVAPGVIETPVPGGLSLQDLQLIIRDVFAHFRVMAACLAVYNPERDQDGKTLRAGLQIIGSIAECVATMK